VGLDWGDVSQIRDRLKLTPTERIEDCPGFDEHVIRIRSQNGHRAKLTRAKVPAMRVG